MLCLNNVDSEIHSDEFWFENQLERPCLRLIINSWIGRTAGSACVEGGPEGKGREVTTRIPRLKCKHTVHPSCITDFAPTMLLRKLEATLFSPETLKS
jgi:hypothetical protein